LWFYAHADQTACAITFDHLNQESYDMEPCELFGFNTGNFETVVKTVDLKDGDKKIPFWLAKDSDLIVLVSGDIKRLTTVADAVYTAHVDHGIPQIAVDCNQLSQKTKTQDLIEIKTSRYPGHAELIIMSNTRAAMRFNTL
jgi:hypothetical protein